MYEAYSKKIKSIINISYALKHPDREEHYKCPNPSCDAEFYPKALKNCNVRPHFCRYKTTLHVNVNHLRGIRSYFSYCDRTSYHEEQKVWEQICQV